jgi:hypothetical protein
MKTILFSHAFAKYLGMSILLHTRFSPCAFTLPALLPFLPLTPAHPPTRAHAGSKERFADDERRQLASLSATHQSVLRQIAKTKAEMRDMEAETAAFREQLAAIGAAKAHKK